MKSVAHISDLHFGRTEPALVEALLAELKALKPSVIAVSGDLTQDARSAVSARPISLVSGASGGGRKGWCATTTFSMPRGSARSVSRTRSICSRLIEPCDQFQCATSRRAVLTPISTIPSWTSSGAVSGVM